MGAWGVHAKDVRYSTVRYVKNVTFQVTYGWTKSGSERVRAKSKREAETT